MATVKFTQVKSANGANPKQRDTLRSLGLGKIGRASEKEDGDVLRGMLAKVSHLVRIDG
ncbi:MAG: large subunit ribosomal protein [Thermoleophilaceae bacterium]|jgi:large subunit ribosomal protein L30|nr:large subunit ribosomal protein [Thermoleophilaceae bacterium]